MSRGIGRPRKTIGQEVENPDIGENFWAFYFILHQNLWKILSFQKATPQDPWWELYLCDITPSNKYPTTCIAPGAPERAVEITRRLVGVFLSDKWIGRDLESCVGEEALGLKVVTLLFFVWCRSNDVAHASRVWNRPGSVVLVKDAKDLGLEVAERMEPAMEMEVTSHSFRLCVLFRLSWGSDTPYASASITEYFKVEVYVTREAFKFAARSVEKRKIRGRPYS
eukprot:TRINITY_DN13854_c1_g2_i3.p1 TRINITY_DN13854_c1_g2~~TRINITY_DN13854_c1_g2_i3.p1  ORF type:complete len:224 (-),score=38.15 TRINITY_DN13854_c1_g2_i3:68-739(-)